MKNKVMFILFMFSTLLYSHESHFDEKVENIYEKMIHWLGYFHPIFLHFPLALIVMTAISEFLFFRYKTPLFDHASRFMISSAAISAIPTALFGFALAYQTHYEGALATSFWWHRFFGIFTTVLAIGTAILRELHTRKKLKTLKIYYYCLLLLLVSANVTGFFGMDFI